MSDVSRRLTVGPFNRVEGDLEVKLEIEDGRVAAAFVTVPMYRGFEQILHGRPASDALVIAPRICGICSVSQSTAAARALGQVMGLEPPVNGRTVADLILACENAADHLTHFYLFFLPDFARAAYQGRDWYGEALTRFQAQAGASVRAAQAARTSFLHVMGILAGKWPHNLVLQPGGVTKSVDVGERMRLRAVLAEFRSFLETKVFADSLERIAALDGPAALLDWCAARPAGEGDFRFFLHMAEDAGLAGAGLGPARFLSYGGFTGTDGPLYAAGLWRDDGLWPLELSGLREDLSHVWMSGANLHPQQGFSMPDIDKYDAYSWCKAPRLDGAGVEVGAFARQMVAGHPLIRGLAARTGGRATVSGRVIARLLELALLVPAMERWVLLLAEPGPYCRDGDLPAQGRGVGLVEAARGGLGHWLTVEDGRIGHYQIVAPTTWNFSPRDGAGVPGPLEQALVGAAVAADEDFPLTVQHIVRSFDPCMNCTVH